MSNPLKQVYQAKNKLQFYSDKTVPVDLYRAQKITEIKKKFPLLTPNRGFVRSDGTLRVADVLIEVVDGQEIVRGCTTIKGMFRGISVFDKPRQFANHKWFVLAAEAPIPGGLAITQDGTSSHEPNHYTIAPINDMPLALFQVCLNALAIYMKPID